MRDPRRNKEFYVARASRRCISSTSSTTERAPSLRMPRARWSSTVRTLMPRFTATTLLVSPRVTFTTGQRAEAPGGGTPLPVTGERLAYLGKQRGRIERLFQKIDRARLQCADRRGNGAESGDEDNRWSVVDAGQTLLEVESAQSGQPDIGDEAARLAPIPLGEKAPRRVERSHRQSFRSNEHRDRVARCRIVIDHENDHIVTHGSRTPTVEGNVLWFRLSGIDLVPNRPRIQL